MKQPQCGGSKSLSYLNVIYALFQQSGDNTIYFADVTHKNMHFRTVI